MRLLHSNDSPGVHAPSWYKATSSHNEYPSLSSSVDTDVCVIGGGYTGIGAALHLAKSGVDVVLLEAHRVGWGASGRNGGQLGSGFNLSQVDLEAQLGIPAAKQLWQFCEDAKQNIRTICDEYSIDIEYRPGIVSAMHRKRFVKEHHQYCNKLRDDYQYDQIEILSKTELETRVNSKHYFGGSIDHGAGHVHPLKLAQGLAKAATHHGVKIHELSQVQKIDYHAGYAQTDKHRVNAKHFVLACNGYIDELDPVFARSVFPINNFMVATEPLGELANTLLPFNDAVADSRFVVNYFRLSSDGRMLFGGGENYGYRFPKDIAKEVQRPMLKIFPQLRGCNIEHAWGGTLAITPKRLPVIRKIHPRAYAAGGYSGHGVALSSMCGKAIAEAILGDPSRQDLLQSLPNRAFPGGPTLRPVLQSLAMTAARLLDGL